MSNWRHEVIINKPNWKVPRLFSLGWAIVLAAVLAGAWSGLFTVPSDSVGIVQRFGKYIKEVPPGLHFKIPFGVDIATILPVKRQLKQEFGFSTPGAADPYGSDAVRITRMNPLTSPL